MPRPQERQTWTSAGAAAAAAGAEQATQSPTCCQACHPLCPACAAYCLSQPLLGPAAAPAPAAALPAVCAALLPPGVLRRGRGSAHRCVTGPRPGQLSPAGSKGGVVDAVVDAVVGVAVVLVGAVVCVVVNRNRGRLATPGVWEHACTVKLSAAHLRVWGDQEDPARQRLQTGPQATACPCAQLTHACIGPHGRQILPLRGRSGRLSLHTPACPTDTPTTHPSPHPHPHPHPQPPLPAGDRRPGRGPVTHR